MPIKTSELVALSFYQGAGGQWYRNNDWGNKDPGDNHTHLIGITSAPGYDPVTNRNPTEVLTVTQIELKIRCDGRPIQRVWLVRQTAGDFLMPQMPPGMNAEEKTIARRLYDVLPPQLVAE